MIVIVRLDLDRYDKGVIERLVVNGVITMGEATEAKVIKRLNDLERLQWMRNMQRERETLQKVG